MHPSKTYVALVYFSSVCDVLSTYRTGVLIIRVWIWINIIRYQKEQEFGIETTTVVVVADFRS